MKPILTLFTLFPAAASAHLDGGAHLHDYQAAVVMLLLAGITLYRVFRRRGD